VTGGHIGGLTGFGFGLKLDLAGIIRDFVKSSFQDAFFDGWVGNPSHLTAQPLLPTIAASFNDFPPLTLDRGSQAFLCSVTGNEVQAVNLL